VAGWWERRRGEFDNTASSHGRAFTWPGRSARGEELPCSARGGAQAMLGRPRHAQPALHDEGLRVSHLRTRSACSRCSGTRSSRTSEKIFSLSRVCAVGSWPPTCTANHDVTGGRARVEGGVGAKTNERGIGQLAGDAGHVCYLASSACSTLGLFSG